ncbi:hypothetical protein Tco_0377227, partial [Tanacetum coccineum]
HTNPPSPPKDSDQNKKKRLDSDASGSNPPPPKDSEQSTKKKKDSDTSASRQHSAQTSSARKITNTRDTPSGSSKQQSDSQFDQPTNDIPTSDEEHDSDLDDTDNAYVPKISSRPKWFKHIPKEERPATPESVWVIPENEFLELDNNWANALANTYKDLKENKLLRKTGPTFKLVKAFHKNIISLQSQMEECHKILTDQVNLVNPEGHRVVPDLSKPLPLEGPPGQVTIQPQFFFNKDLEYLLSGDKERRSDLSISKLKATRYLDFGLKELVSSLWIKSERDYDISATYGITHWWFKRKEFYIERHRAPSDRHAVRSYMWILSVISLKTYEIYGYTYLKEIVLRRADYNEYKISECDFKNLHHNDFEDLYLLHIQDKLNHLSRQDKLH